MNKLQSIDQMSLALKVKLSVYSLGGKKPQYESRFHSLFELIYQEGKLLVMKKNKQNYLL